MLPRCPTRSIFSTFTGGKMVGSQLGRIRKGSASGWTEWKRSERKKAISDEVGCLQGTFVGARETRQRQFADRTGRRQPANTSARRPSAGNDAQPISASA